MPGAERPGLEDRLRRRLAETRQRDRHRTRRVAAGPQAPERRVDGKRLLSFASNDYLGLAGHPVIRQALIRGVERWGAGSGAAHLVNGHTGAHQELEEAIAEWLGRERALLFSTGYMANLGLVCALLDRGDLAVCDRLNHASLLDAALLAGARLARFRHADSHHAARCLERAPSRAALVLTDGVFSMDGDVAPLGELADAALGAGAWLCVDDAHGLGVLGPRGTGSTAAAGLTERQAPALVGTLGKAFGTFGAFVAGPGDLVETLIQRARSYIYTTAPPPAVAVATIAALALVTAESWRRERIRALVERLREGARQLGLAMGASETPIQPLLVGGDREALSLSRALESDGIHVPAIRPPTVPQGSARLRIAISARHTEEQVDRLLDALDRQRTNRGANAAREGQSN